MLRRPRHPYSLLTLCAAIAILILGVAFKPGKKSARPLSESDLSRLAPAPAFRFNDLSQGLAEASANAAPRLLYLPGIPHTAVLWDRTRAIAAPNYIGSLADWKSVPIPSDVPFAIWSLPAIADHPMNEPGVTVSIPSGDWVLAVARAGPDRTLFAEGIYQGIGDARCGTFDYREVNSSVDISSGLIGGGLFAVDGKLLGVIALCNGVPSVISSSSIAATLRQPVFITDRLEHDYGLKVNESPAGIQAATVWLGGLADASGIKAGDVIAQVDGRPATQWSDLEPLETSGAHTLIVRRGPGSVRLTLLRRSSATSIDGITFSSSLPKAIVSDVAPNSAAAHAGLQPGDVLLRVAGFPVSTPEAAARALAARAKVPVNIQIERGGPKADVVLAP